MATALLSPEVELVDWAATLNKRQRIELHACAEICDLLLDVGRHDKAVKACESISRFAPRTLRAMLVRYPNRSTWLNGDLWRMFREAIKANRDRGSEKFWTARNTRRQLCSGKTSEQTKIPSGKLSEGPRTRRQTAGRAWPVERETTVHKAGRHRKGVSA